MRMIAGAPLRSGTKAAMCVLALFGERETLVQFSMRSFEAGVESQGSSFLGWNTWISAARRTAQASLGVYWMSLKRFIRSKSRGRCNRGLPSI